MNDVVYAVYAPATSFPGSRDGIPDKDESHVSTVKNGVGSHVHMCIEYYQS
jgi:hypothetical protein